MVYRFVLWVLLFVSFSVSYALPPQADTFQFIALADIHFDPFNSCIAKNNCPLIDELRASKATEWPQILAKYDVQPQQMKRDTGYELLTSAMTLAKEAAHVNHPQFVLVLGDFLAHEFRDKYKRYSSDKHAFNYESFVQKTLTFLNNQLAHDFPSLTIYCVVGNNDSYHGSYYVKPNGTFFKNQALLWSSLIREVSNRDTMQKQFLYAGYYTLTLPYPNNLRLIVLNTSLFSYKAKGRDLNTAALNQLNWLHAQLQQAKNAHQRVFIAMHIPEGIDIYATTHTRLFRLINLWKSPYIQRFEVEMNQFSAEIAGIFTGHLHRNQFQLLTYQDGHEIPFIGVTSISPIFGNEPGFRSISYFMHPIHLDDITTYSFPIGVGSAKLQESQE